MKNTIITTTYLVLITSLSTLNTSCTKEDTNDSEVSCPESFFDDKLDTSRNLEENTMVFDNKTYKFTSIKSSKEYWQGEMYEIEAELNGFELWVRFDPETKKGCRNTLRTEGILPGSFPNKDNSEIGIVMYDHYNYLMNETFQTSNSPENYGYAEIFYNENEIVVKINNVPMGHMTFWEEPRKDLSFHISAPYPETD